MKWTNFEIMDYLWSLLIIIFSISFSKVLRRMMGQNILGESYISLLGLKIMIDKEFLKCNSQWLRLIHVLVILIISSKHLLFFKTSFKCFHNIWLGPRVDKLLYLSIVFLSFFFKKDGYSNLGFERISFNILVFIW